MNGGLDNLKTRLCKITQPNVLIHHYIAIIALVIYHHHHIHNRRKIKILFHMTHRARTAVSHTNIRYVVLAAYLSPILHTCMCIQHIYNITCNICVVRCMLLCRVAFHVKKIQELQVDLLNMASIAGTLYVCSVCYADRTHREPVRHISTSICALHVQTG